MNARFSSKMLEGRFSIESRDRTLPFKANYYLADRFGKNVPAALNVSGIWETAFSPDSEDSYLAKGMFIQKVGKDSGAFRTASGAYRYLEAVMGKEILIGLLRNY